MSVVDFPTARRWWGMGAITTVAAVLVVMVAFRPGAHEWGRPVRDASGPYNVLLISLDTTRQDHLSCYGYERQTTPHIDRIARDGILFTRGVAVSNWTLPSHASMLTGLFPTTHGAHWINDAESQKGSSNPTGLMYQACVTLAEILRDAGYNTAAIVANTAYLNRAFQLDQGFDLYDDRPGSPPAPYRPATEIVDEVIRWVERSGDRPFFLFVNFMDPHVPYNPPPPYHTYFRKHLDSPPVRSWGMRFWSEIRETVLTNQKPLSPELRASFVDRYDEEIVYMDSGIGRMISWLRSRGIYDRTLIVLTSDHGEAFGEHCLMGHGLALYEPEIAVPMILKLPFSREQGIRDHGVQHVDIMPTVLEILGLPIPEEVQGASMLVATERDLVAEEYVCRGNARVWPRFDRMQRALYRGQYKFIEYSDGECELYDLQHDPEELQNLAGTGENDVRALQAVLRRWQDRVRPLGPEPASRAPLAAPEIQQLRQLGYLH